MRVQAFKDGKHRYFSCVKAKMPDRARLKETTQTDLLSKCILPKGAAALYETFGTIVFAWVPITELLENTIDNRWFCKMAVQDCQRRGHMLARVIHCGEMVGAYRGDTVAQAMECYAASRAMEESEGTRKTVSVLDGRADNLARADVELLDKVYVCLVCGKRTRRDVNGREYTFEGKAWRHTGTSRHSKCCAECLGEYRVELSVKVEWNTKSQ